MTVVLHPSTHSEIERLRTLAELNAEQAKLNAETIAEQQRHYDEVLTRLHREYQRQLAERNDLIAAIKGGVASIIKQRNDAEKKLRDQQRLLENAVVPDHIRPGQLTTIWTIVEFNEYRVRCARCQDLPCEGCNAEITS